MKRFTVTHLLLLVTWSGIVFYVIARHTHPYPYRGAIHDASGWTHFDYALDHQLGTELGDFSVENRPLTRRNRHHDLGDPA